MKDLGRDEALDRLLERTLRTAAEAHWSNDCPDAEILGAWFSEEKLTKAERTSVGIHVADCARCQAQLAAMVRMTSADPVVVPRWHLWQWLVPATAAATAVAFWVWVQPVPPRTPQEEASQMQAAAPSAVEKPPMPQAAPAPQAPPARDENTKARALRQRPPALPPDASARQNRLADAQKWEIDMRAAQRAQPKDAAKPAEPQRTDAVAERRERAAEGAAAAAAPAAPSALAESVAVQPIEIRSPDPAVSWRVVGGSTVVRTTDGGGSWHPQVTGVSRPLTAGSSPAPLVCWLVGEQGTVLLSTDGRTWRRVPFPDAVDLTSVQATDARTAAVTTADGRRLATSDGGLTWRALQENPAAPF